MEISTNIRKSADKIEISKCALFIQDVFGCELMEFFVNFLSLLVKIISVNHNKR